MLQSTNITPINFSKTYERAEKLWEAKSYLKFYGICFKNLDLTFCGDFDKQVRLDYPLFHGLRIPKQ